MFTVEDKLGAVQEAGVVKEHGVPNVRFPAALVNAVVNVDVPTYATKPDVVAQVKPTD